MWIIDDPIASGDRTTSDVYFDAFAAAFARAALPPGAVMQMWGTRWHPNDLMRKILDGSNGKTERST